LLFVQFIENLGEKVIRYSLGTYDFLLLLFQCISQIFSLKSYEKTARTFFIEQIYLSTIKHLFSFVLFAIFLGSILIVIAISFAINFSLLDQIGDLLVLFVINVFSPFFTTCYFILSYSLSSEEKIQNMKKDRDMSNIINEIYIPKILNALFIIPLMALLFASIMLASGYVVSYFYLNIDLETYKNLIISSVSFKNILILLIKTSVFGFISIFIPIFFGHKKEKTSSNITSFIVRILVIILSMLFLIELLSILIFY
jgi:ABC-type transporter Mla maintaining outer membrane lipid asymmetry permease subunit MlaE